MKKITTLFFATFVILLSSAQVYPYRDFDKVELNNINGSVDIEIGKDFNVEIMGLPIKSDLLSVEVLPEYKLVITIKKALSWEVMKNINLKIKIVMPEISKLYNNSNANVSITNFIGRYIGIENNGNGNVNLQGSIVDLLDIENTGNGDCSTKSINAKQVTITKAGNGNVQIKTNEPFNAKLSGNGDVINYGKGKATVLKQSGNGQVIYKS